MLPLPDHAAEATEAVRKLLGKSYSYSSENVFVSMWKTFNNCLVRHIDLLLALSPSAARAEDGRARRRSIQFIEDEGDVRFYKDRRGVARAFVKDA
jgi:hypothetical protein